MTLTDTGPLLALINKRETLHTPCTVLLASLSLPLVTTWPCMAEAMHIAYREGGWNMQNLLWSLYTRGVLVIHVNSDAEIDHMRILMDKYHDTPMDLADASLMAALETLSIRRIFTLDSDFHVYRFADGTAPEVLL